MGSQSRRWCFTLNNFTEDDEVNIPTWETTYTTYGREIGSEGTKHLQGFVVFPKAKRLVAVKALHGRCHWEVARGTSEQARDYCWKDGDYVEFGRFPGSQGRRNDIREAVATLKEYGLKRVAEEHPEVFVKYGRGFRDMNLLLQGEYSHHRCRGVWIYGPPGTGKTHSVKTFFDSVYNKPQSKWWDGYDGESVVLLDDFDSGVLGHYLKIWSDKYSCTGETKGGTVHLRHKLFIITSNYYPEHFWPEDNSMCEAIERRFVLIEKLEKETNIDFNLYLE